MIDILPERLEYRTADLARVSGRGTRTVLYHVNYLLTKGLIEVPRQERAPWRFDPPTARTILAHMTQNRHIRSNF